MATEPDKAEKADRARRRWLGRWLAKLTLWFITLSLSAALIGGVVSVIAYRNLTGLANLAVTRFAEPYRVKFGRVDVSKGGLIRLEEVSVHPPKSMAGEGDEPWIVLAGADLTYDFAELRREYRFRSIVLRSPVIRIDDASLEVLGLNRDGTEGKGSGETAPPLDLSRLGRITDRIEIVGGQWVVDTSKGPRVSGTWDATVPPIDFGAEEWLNLEPLVLRLGELQFGPSGEWGSIDRISVSGRVRSDLKGIEIGELAVDSPKLEITPGWLPGDRVSEEEEKTVDPPERERELAETEPAGDPFELLIGALTVRGAELSMSGFDGSPGIPKWPDLSLKSELAWRDLVIEGGGLRSEDFLVLALTDGTVGAVGPDEGPPLAQFEKLAVKFDPAAWRDRGRIESVELEAPRLFLTPEGTEKIRRRATDSEAAVGPPEGSKDRNRDAATPDEPGWEIGVATIRGGELSARDWSWKERKLPPVSLRIEAALRDLSSESFERTQSGEPESGESPQRIELSRVRIEGNDAEEDAFEVERLAAQFRWGALMGDGLIDELLLEKPILRLTDRALPDWVRDWKPETVESGADSAPASDAAPPAEPDDVRVWAAESLTITGGEVTLGTAALQGRLPKLEAAFSLAALPGESGVAAIADDRLHRLQFQRLRVLDGGPVQSTGEAGSTEKLGGLFPADVPEDDGEQKEGAQRSIADQDVALLRELSIDFSAAGLQRDRRIERIEVKGGEFQVGDALQRLVDGPASSTDGAAGQPEAVPLQAVPKPDTPVPQSPSASDPQAAATPVSTVEVKGWRVGEVVITETQVRFQSLIPQIEGLEFGIETKLQDIPLNEVGFLTQDRKQKIEIAGIEIRDPYDSFITVAFLPTIFVEFSLAGLVSQRIDKIDLLNPAIYVGQGLFWWIDYQRNYRKQNEGVAIGGAPAAEVIGVDNAAAENPGGASNWVIDEINAHFGKIVIAPTGQPIGIVPFPFSASTNLNKGEIALRLQIPREQQYVYQFPDFELDLYGLEGNIEFNVPIKQQDNNLVQTFTLDRAVWKQHEAESLFLSVTYDTNGVYGKFGGMSYGGYAEGQFNFYLNEVGRWDAWIAGTDMNMGPITEVVTPENFLMDGKVNAKLVSEGNGLLFGETTGEIVALSPGRIDVSKLDELIDGLPEGWSQMKRSITQLGLETLKEFEYDGGRVDLHFINQDGWLRLDLNGPAGSRHLEVFAHDWRNGEEIPAFSTGNAASGNVPEVAKRVPSVPQSATETGGAPAKVAPPREGLAQRPLPGSGRPDRIRR